VKDEQRENNPAPVPERAKQAGEIRDRWSWVEPSVWTERMLTALDKGVKGGRWHSLVDKVYSERNLRVAFKKVKTNRGSAGVDNQTIEMFEKKLEENLNRLQEALSEGTYHPQGIRRVWIPNCRASASEILNPVTTNKAKSVL
jgi:RNA-directed DNA polymerase